jgi:hypothetical protein
LGADELRATLLGEVEVDARLLGVVDLDERVRLFKRVRVLG